MIPALFYVSAIYDAILGLIFLFAPSQAFCWFHVPPPNHFGYVQFPAALLLIFSLMFVAIARNPFENRRLIIYGTLLKLSYCSVTLLYWVQGMLPAMWQPFTVCDAVMGLLYVWAYVTLEKEGNLGTAFS